MVADFYKDLEIFITGGSGVVGKAAIEKLLRSCDVKKIYVLLRCKKGVSVADRLEEIKNLRIFNVLKKCKPNELDKLIAIPGDTALNGLGISPEHREMIKNVSVFFHSAATTRFDEPLRKAIRVNIQSTLESLRIAETLKNLKIFIHVSTFYSNPYLDYVQDKVYPAKFDWRTALKMLDSENDKIDPTLNAITQKTISGFCNTYLFTKHLSEQLVNEYRHKLPVGIFRPSIVVGAVEEPEPGFTETTTGVMGLILIWGTGLIKVLSSRTDIKVDITPLDIGTKTMLIFTSKSAQLQREKLKEATPVGMWSSDGLHNYSFGEFAKFMTKASHDYAYEKCIWIPGVKTTMCPYIFTIYSVFLQLLPALLIDVLLKIFRRKPIMMKIQRKIRITTDVLSFFLKHTIKSDGPTYYQEILKTYKGTDFAVNIIDTCAKVDEDMCSTISLFTRGCRKYLLNEDENSLPRCRKILKWKIIVYNIVRLFVLYIIGRAIYLRVLNCFSK